ncbi:MAG: hypothetical protein ABIT16_11115 [Croceibacterium sp.]
MRHWPIFVLAGLVAGCSGEPQPDSNPSVAAPAASPQIESSSEPTLDAEDLALAQLSGTVGCAFTQAGQQGPILVARTDPRNGARADGLVKVDASAIRLRSDRAGGLTAMVHGGRFKGGDLRAQVAVLSDKPDTDDPQSYPARLEVGSSTAGSQVIEGRWTCGG